MLSTHHLCAGVSLLLFEAVAAAHAHPPRPDFNGDGFDDLAVAAPNEDVDGAANAGAVHVIYGSAGGLRVFGNQRWTQNSPGVPEVAEDFDRFGSSLAWGDFNGDGFSDLAIGAPLEDVQIAGDTIPDAGCVIILYGSSGGLTSAGAQLFSQNSIAIIGTAQIGDQFGWSLAAGDFNGDGRDDLAIGIIGEDLFNNNIVAPDAGAVAVLYGSATGLSGFGNQLWTQDSFGVPDRAENGDRFGYALATGDFDGDGFADLAIGVPGEDVAVVNGFGVAPDAGAVNVIYGSATRLNGSGAQLWTQNSPAIAQVADPGDMFGFALAAGDFNGDGRDDLAIAAPFQNFGTILQAGVVQVIFGTSVGLLSPGNIALDESTLGLNIGGGEDFGFALAAGDFNHDGVDDLAISAPIAPVGPFFNAGEVFVVPGAHAGLAIGGAQIWTQDSPGIRDRVENDDRFGESLWIGDFNGDGRDDLAIGSPHEDVAGFSDAGAVNVIYGHGGSAGLRAPGNQFFSMHTPGMVGSVETGGFFGWRVTATP